MTTDELVAESRRLQAKLAEAAGELADWTQRLKIVLAGMDGDTNGNGHPARS